MSSTLTNLKQQPECFPRLCTNFSMKSNKQVPKIQITKCFRHHYQRSIFSGMFIYKNYVVSSCMLCISFLSNLVIQSAFKLSNYLVFLIFPVFVFKCSKCILIPRNTIINCHELTVLQHMKKLFWILILWLSRNTSKKFI